MTIKLKTLLTAGMILFSVNLTPSPALARTHTSHASHLTHSLEHTDAHESQSNTEREKTVTTNHTFDKHNLRQSLQHAYHKQHVITNPALWILMAHHNRLTDSHVKKCGLPARLQTRLSNG